jgi:hypothetical protein
MQVGPFGDFATTVAQDRDRQVGGAGGCVWRNATTGPD